MIPPVNTPSDRPRRADAVRNREKVLEAANACFSQDGLDAQMPDIARRACVGVGTIYRHFPNKDQLIEALAHQHFERLVGVASEHVARDDADPWENFAGFLWTAAQLFVDNRGLAELAATLPVAMRPGPEQRDRLLALIGALMDRARQDGAMRDDARPEDVPTIMCGLGRVATTQRCGAPVDWQRYLELVLDGLRAR